MGTIREEILESVEQSFRSRSAPGVAEVIPPPARTAERVSPFTVVLLEDGSAGVCWNLLEGSDRSDYGALDLAGWRGRDALALARELLAPERARRVVGYAACAALSQVCFRAGEPAVDTGTELLDLAGVGPEERVGLVGYAPPFARELALRGARVTVLEREGTVPERAGVELARTPRDLGECRVVFITSTTLLDDSFDELEPLTRAAGFRALYGPGAGILPGALFRRGLDALGGMLIGDGRALAERQRLGRPWGDAKRKFVLRRG